ncbi:PIG-X [Roridomyces roridus]|uniref:Protein PBN1 n=1 Tax=Roridomyces roridus TaxID=1738132 RepID=A0AAD7FH51_9AGAR|nr:PIG-X [Roridomyces roridus]
MPMTTSSSILQPQSFHPVFETSITADGFDNCSLNLLYTLPPIVFIDAYELANRADAYTFQYAGPPSSSNLELPVAAVAKEDASVLLSTPWATSDSSRVVELPFHVRYGPATDDEQTFVETPLSWPDVFFACPSGSDTSALPPMPASLSAPFASMSIFPVHPPPDAVPEEIIRTPVGTTADVARVELGTAVVVIASFFFLVRVARRTVRRLNSGNRVLTAREE